MRYTGLILTIATVNFDQLVNFYSDLLAEKPNTLIPHVYAEFKIGGLTLGIFQPKEEHQSEFRKNSQSPISLCFEVHDLENAIAHLENLGYPPPGEISTASHGREIYAYDPDGNPLILHQSH
jgi:predicted enzyme related to lactoylglutathione lyase